MTSNPPLSDFLLGSCGDLRGPRGSSWSGRPNHPTPDAHWSKAYATAERPGLVHPAGTSLAPEP